MNKIKKQLIRIVVCITAFLAVFIVDKTIGLNQYVALGLYLAIYLAIAYDVLWRAAKNISHGQVFDENFLMCVATIGAFILADYPEAAAVMLFYQVGELFQSYAVGKSRKSIAALMDIRPDKAVVLRDGQEVELMPEEVAVGDILIIRPGERVPIDGVVTEGESSLDTSALTGESVPRRIVAGDVALSGSINISGVIRLRAEKEFYDSTVSKILDMVENASVKKAKAENFIGKFARYYTPAVVLAAVLIAIIPAAVDGNWSMWVTRALTFLVISCPCALVISVPMSFFGGIGCASKNGILMKGASYMELLNKANIFVFDKTGTLTEGVFKVKRVVPEESRESILKCAALAEYGSLHPIAKSILAVSPVDGNVGMAVTEHSGKGLEARKDGQIILAGNARLMTENGIEFEQLSDTGSIVYVAENGNYLGAIVIADIPRANSAEVIGALNKRGAKTIMLTGDNEEYACEIAQEVGVGEYKSGLLPSDKVDALEDIMKSKGKGDAVVFVGDGINDAPVLMRADVGVSMGGIGSDSAVEASDMVLMHDNLEGLITAKKISEKTFRIVRENISVILIVKAAVLVLGALGIANMWLAVFADVGLAVLATLNALRALRLKKE